MATSRQRIEDRIKRKEVEILEFEMKIREARSYVQALNDTIKLLPRDDDAPAYTILRAGSGVAKARAKGRNFYSPSTQHV